MSKGQKEKAKELAGRATKKGTKAGNAPTEEKKGKKEKEKEKATEKERAKGSRSSVTDVAGKGIKQQIAGAEKGKEDTGRKVERDGE